MTRISREAWRGRVRSGARLAAALLLAACAPRALHTPDEALADAAERPVAGSAQATLEAATASDDPAVRAIAMVGLARRDATWLGRALFDPDPWVQRAAAAAIDLPDQADLAHAFVLSSADAGARASLIERWGDAAREPAIAAWNTASPSQRLALAPAVWRWVAEATPTWAQRARQADLRIPPTAWAMAGRSGNAAWREPVAAALPDAEEENRIDLLFCAMHLGDAGARGELVSLTRDPDWRPTLLDLSVLPADHGLLTHLATGDDPTALVARARLGQVAATDVNTAFDAPDVFLRAAAAAAAAHLPAERARALLARRVADPSPVVRVAVVRAFQQVGPGSSPGALSTLLSDPFPEARVGAAALLISQDVP